VGAGLRDLQAAAAVGAQPLLVLTGNGKKTQRAGDLPPGARVFADLAAAVDTMVE
jgi:D-glycero-D-manno-heptose 1,7-bisphosphate phosphatase